MKILLCRLLVLMLLVSTVGAEEEFPEEIPLFSQAELDQMLAPVALYPDALLSQILMAATYPLEVVQAARWSRANPDLKGEQAVRAANDRGWDPSVQSLVAFPEVLAEMDRNLDWTEQLGDAFLAQQTQVMDTVQDLRQRAYAAGNLRSDERAHVHRQGDVIVVQPAYREVIYVPYYDPYTVYGRWWWPAYQPVYWAPWSGYQYYSGHGHYSGFYWGSGIRIGSGFFFSAWDWPSYNVRIVQTRPFYYRRPPPVHHVWVHDYRHRRGVPYRHKDVYRRYAGHDAALAPRHDYTRQRLDRDARYRDRSDGTKPRNDARGQQRVDRVAHDQQRQEKQQRRYNTAQTVDTRSEPRRQQQQSLAPGRDAAGNANARIESPAPVTSTEGQRQDRANARQNGAREAQRSRPQSGERAIAQTQDRRSQSTRTPAERATRQEQGAQMARPQRERPSQPTQQREQREQRREAAVTRQTVQPQQSFSSPQPAPPAREAREARPERQERQERAAARERGRP
jgi:hypothetical protein